jgi:hypothetical protein
VDDLVAIGRLTCPNSVDYPAEESACVICLQLDSLIVNWLSPPMSDTYQLCHSGWQISYVLHITLLVVHAKKGIMLDDSRV